MVKNGQSATELLRHVRFHNPRLQSLGLDTLTVSQLGSKCPPEYFAQSERLEFYQLIYFTGGRGVHQLDFRYYQIRRGTLIIAQPKQVQQFHLNPSLKGRLLLIEPAFLAASAQSVTEPSLEMTDWPAWLELPPWLNGDVARALDIVARETSDYQGDPLTARFLKHVILALLLEIQRFALRSQPVNKQHLAHSSEVLRLLKAEVETSFHRERSVRYYARRLGYSEKTLTRACIAAEGRTAKEMVDDRVALEAKRLLAHSRSSFAEIGCLLGFSEATNFVKFFKRMARVTPSAFRSRLSATAGSSGSS